jgi:proline-specific peptidase
VSAPAREGFVRFRGFNVWYRVVGLRSDPRLLPLLVLHGGPGVPHDYLEPLAALAATGRQVVFYDQLGCGSSDRPGDSELWTVDVFLDELDAMTAALELERFHLLGHSWGGMLAMEHALRGARGLAGLVLASAPASMPHWISEAKRLRADLPATVQRQLAQHEADGTTGSAEYAEAAAVYYRRHLCRLDPWPDCLTASLTKLAENPEVYNVMCGPSDFHVTGKLRHWDIAARLSSIRAPTLVTSGRYDEATPAIAGAVHERIRRSSWTLFEDSSHMPHLEESGRYLRVVERFLRQSDAAA